MRPRRDVRDRSHHGVRLHRSQILDAELGVVEDHQALLYIRSVDQDADEAEPARPGAVGFAGEEMNSVAVVLGGTVIDVDATSSKLVDDVCEKPPVAHA